VQRKFKPSLQFSCPQRARQHHRNLNLQ